MNIALIGYGKMGQEIEKIALDRGHEVPFIYDIHNIEELTPENLKKADVVIEFSRPESAVENYLKCFQAGVPVVSGTTGWLDRKEEVEKACQNSNGTFFYASNFSLGVNLFFELNKKLAEMMKPFKEYNVFMTEIHHTQKLDAPSGTAISLAENIMEILPEKKKWVNELTQASDELGIVSLREGTVPGIHTITYDSAVDYIEITHSAKSRKGFALGAVIAAEFCIHKKGLIGMKDLLKL